MRRKASIAASFILPESQATHANSPAKNTRNSAYTYLTERFGESFQPSMYHELPVEDQVCNTHCAARPLARSLAIQHHTPHTLSCRTMQVSELRFSGERTYESAHRMLKHMGKEYSKQMTAHGFTATQEDVNTAFKAAEKLMDLADAVEHTASKTTSSGKRAREEDFGHVSPRASGKKRVGSPRSAVKLSDGGPSSGHNVNGPGHGLAAIRAGALPAPKVSPVAKVRNHIEWAARTRVPIRRLTRRF